MKGLPFFHRHTPVQRLLIRRVLTGVEKLFTLSGSIVSFVTNLVRPLKIVVGIDPVQSGSGDPSPDNIRPISGWTGCNVSRTNGKELTDPDYVGQTYPISWQSTAGTVYGGQLDVTTGVLTVTHDGYALTGEESWGTLATPNVYYFNPSPRMSSGRHRYDNKAKCNMFAKSIQSSGVNLEDNHAMFGSGNSYVYFKHSQSADVDAWKTFLQNNSVFITYPLATPVTYTLSELDVIETLKGVNNVWADTGDVTVTYSKKV